MRWTYAKAGVDIAKEDAFVRSLLSAVSTGSTVEIKGFASLFDLGESMLAISTDGVGTKILVAKELGKWDTIGIDCVAMNVNDVLCVGAKPLCFVDYLAVERLDERIAREIGKGLQRGAEIAGVQWIGGETATLPEIVRGFDLSGTCIGLVAKEKVIRPRIERGDLILGIPSSGIHCNGLTLARKVIKHAGFSLKDPFPLDEGKSIGEELLTPTRIYTAEILSLLNSCEIHGLAHITGGGFLKLRRLLTTAKALGIHIYDPLPMQPIYEFLQECGNIPLEEMLRTFNCGMGFAVVIPRGEEREALRVVKDGKIVGEVVSEPHIRVDFADASVSI